MQTVNHDNNIEAHTFIILRCIIGTFPEQTHHNVVMSNGTELEELY